ncbi:MAG: HEAT repeat domain-containing protein [Spirulinaceae cyanobacterium]
MELIKQTKLHYQAENSDKVYEVDLSCVGEDRYLVNFRYGKRGGNLKEGTKTTEPIPLAEAEKTFTKLVASKTKKGYEEVSQQQGKAEPKQINKESRNQAIITRLANGSDNKWALDRVIWRAGELKIQAATPLLMTLLGTGEPLRDYSIAWSLGWCGDETTIPLLQELWQNDSQPEFVRRIAWEAAYKLANAECQDRMRQDKLRELPTSLFELASGGLAIDFQQRLEEYLHDGSHENFAVIDTIYQIDNEFVRPALLHILRTANFVPNYFRSIRHIFKMAEYRRDGEFLGIIAYRLETEKAMYHSNNWGVYHKDIGYLRTSNRQWNQETRSYEELEQSPFQQEMQRPDARIAYSSATREYLQRRVWRTLRRLGQDAETDYAPLATGVLLQYSDADAQGVKKGTYYRWDSASRTYHSFTSDWDAFAGYLTFNHILYTNSPRYFLPSNRQAWRCQQGYKPGDPIPEVREEAFPELWEQQPEFLLRLLSQSDCTPVHDFAAKALRCCTAFCGEIDTANLITLINKPYLATTQLAFALIRDRYNPDEPNLELVLAIINCNFQEAREQGYEWIEVQKEYFLAVDGFLVGLITSSYPDSRSFTRRLLSTITLRDDHAKILIAQVIAALLALSSEQGELAQDIAETLLISFPSQLRTLGFGVIEDLLASPLVEVQVVGATILLHHQIAPADLPPHLLESLLASGYEQVRTIGVRVFGQLPDEILRGDRLFLVAMAVNSSSDIRKAIRSVIRRITTGQRDFALQLATDLLDLLVEPESHEGVHKDLVNLLQQEIPYWQSSISRSRTMELLCSKSSVVQELGGILLQENHSRFLNEFSTREIVQLANQEILAVRQAAWEMFSASLSRIRSNPEEMLVAVRLLEAKWEDSRQFALQVFEDFREEDWTPDVMVSVCDSTNEKARRFGRDLLSRYFQPNYGYQYLLKFSEHPSKDMQKFATNYLESYAQNNPERLEQLSPYFITVLSGVNCGRVAKERIFNFLATEAEKSREVATTVAKILTRQSLTVVIKDKAKAIETMLKIKKQYPNIDLPIQVKEVMLIKH